MVQKPNWVNTVSIVGSASNRASEKLAGAYARFNKQVAFEEQRQADMEKQREKAINAQNIQLHYAEKRKKAKKTEEVNEQQRLKSIQTASEQLRDQLPSTQTITSGMINAQIGSGGTWARVTQDQAREEQMVKYRQDAIDSMPTIEQDETNRIWNEAHKDDEDEDGKNNFERRVVFSDLPGAVRNRMIIAAEQRLITDDLFASAESIDDWEEVMYRDAQLELFENETTMIIEKSWADSAQADALKLPWYRGDKIKAELKSRLPQKEDDRIIFNQLGELREYDDTLNQTGTLASGQPSMEQFGQEYFESQGWDYKINRGTASPRDVVDYDQHTRLANKAYEDKYGKDALLNSQFGRAVSFAYSPARAIRPEVKWEDVTTAEHIFGIGQLALYVVAPATRMIPGVGGAVLRMGTTGVSAAAFTTHTAMEWDNMTTEQRVISIGFDALLWAGFIVQIPGLKTDIKMAKSYYNTNLYKEMPANLKGTAFDNKWKNLWVEINRAARKEDVTSMDRARKLYAELKEDMLKHGYEPNSGWKVYTDAALGQGTPKVPATQSVALEVQKMKAKATSTIVPPPTGTMSPTPITAQPITQPSSVQATPVVTATTKPEMEALIKQGYEYDFDTQTWGKPNVKPETKAVAPDETAKPTEQAVSAENEAQLEVEPKRRKPADEPAEIDERYVLTNPRVKEDGYGIGTEFEVKEPSGETVTIYRAVTKDIQNIQPFEYVTLSEEYAQFHLDNHTSGDIVENKALQQGGHIVSAQVSKSELEVLAGNELVWKPQSTTQPETTSMTGMETGTSTEFEGTTAMANWSTDIDAIMASQKTAPDVIPKITPEATPKPTPSGMATNGQKARVHIIAGEKNLSSEKYMEIAKKITGKSSVADMTSKEADNFVKALEGIAESPSKPPSKALELASGYMTRPFGTPAIPERFITPQSRYGQKLGLYEFMRPVEQAKRQMQHYYIQDGNNVRQMIHGINKDAGTSVAEQTQAKIKNVPTKAVEQMRNWLDTYEEPPDFLTPKQTEHFNYFRNLNRTVLTETNKARKTMGLDPIPYRQAYVRHGLSIMAEQIIAGDMAYPSELPNWEQNVGKKIPNPMEKARKLAEDLEGIFSTDLEKITLSMLKTAYRYIYLSEPINNFMEQIDNIEKIPANSSTLPIGKQPIAPKMQDMPAATKTWAKQWINENIKEQPTGTDLDFNRQLTQYGIKGYIDKVLKPVGRKTGDYPITKIAQVTGQMVIHGVLSGRPKIVVRNVFQTGQNVGLYGWKNTMKGIVSGNEELEGLIDESLFIKNYTGIEEQSAGAFGKVEAFVTGGYRWSAVGNAVRAMRGSYYTTRPYITEKKYKNLGWASEKRTYTEPEGKLYPDERARLLEKMENDTKTSQYGYSQLDLPGVFRHKTLTPITRLQSWWMNYFTNYLPEMTHRLFKGSVGYNPNLKLPMKDKVNILKYLFTVAPIMKKLGFKRSVLLGVLPTYMSPVSQLAIGLLQYLGADNDYQRDKAVRQMKGSISATVPGSLAWKDFSSVWSGEKPLSSLFLYDTD